ncbi:uncharacterized protein C8Q71DRAFT_290278 [Rhodofomes roseus]|uniref:F-box domain-containing protein n=1 Tax=Rhodofomes roseus TaxID=34475 RepID=A0ABQ8K542_9APHY|nr:uncharacterized protein C8Q71DRAFT_290278 [Rhodofomes roseus]KAH9831538.1 hypothetical protein C8Q71DRAFT_290278 [Rhodofomes roseus]
MTENVDTVFEHSLPGGGLRSLSSSCRWIREETMPVLFRRCLVTVEEPICADRFLPQSLWPYVYHLSLRDGCPDRAAARPHSWRKPKLHFTDDPLLCGTMDPEFLRTTLRAMPRLQSISLDLMCRESHGLGWDSLAAILSTPQLRSFTLAQFMFSPRHSLTTDSVEFLAPLTTFRHEQRVLRDELRRFLSQEAALGVVIEKLRHTLECLLLASEVAPFRTLMANQWLCLKELHLIGDFYPSPDSRIPFVTLFAEMPKLRVLKLELALHEGVDRQNLQLWPFDDEARFPWPDLIDLVVSFPSPEDRIYSHLPRSMRLLSLQCTPHHYIYSWKLHGLQHLHSPILYATEMLEILANVDAPDLDELRLEYRADAAEDELLACVAQRFPQLTSLEMHRFRSSAGSSVTATGIGLRLAKLENLLTLRLYDDATPHSSFATLQQNAAVIAAKLACPDVRLWLLKIDDDTLWYPFRLVAQQGIDEEPRVEVDPLGHSGVRVFPYDDTALYK